MIKVVERKLGSHTLQVMFKSIRVYAWCLHSAGLTFLEAVKMQNYLNLRKQSANDNI